MCRPLPPGGQGGGWGCRCEIGQDLGAGEMLRVVMLQKGTSVFLLAHTRISFPAQVV